MSTPSIQDELNRLMRERDLYRRYHSNFTGSPPAEQLQWRLLNLEIVVYRALLSREAG